MACAAAPIFMQHKGLVHVADACRAVVRQCCSQICDIVYSIDCSRAMRMVGAGRILHTRKRFADVIARPLLIGVVVLQLGARARMVCMAMAARFSTGRQGGLNHPVKKRMQHARSSCWSEHHGRESDGMGSDYWLTSSGGGASSGESRPPICGTTESPSALIWRPPIMVAEASRGSCRPAPPVGHISPWACPAGRGGGNGMIRVKQQCHRVYQRQPRRKAQNGVGCRGRKGGACSRQPARHCGRGCANERYAYGPLQRKQSVAQGSGSVPLEQG